MRKVVFSLFFTVLALHAFGTVQGEGRAYTVSDVPNVHLSDARQYVSDPSGILSSEARDSINAICSMLNREKGIEAAVVLLPSIGEATPFDFSVELFRTWGIGKKSSNNGLLVLFVADQHKVRFTTGYGIEGDLPDAITKRIQMRYMIPAFKQGDYDTGMVLGMKAAYMALKNAEATKEPKGSFGNKAFTLLFIIGAMALVIILPAFLNKRGMRCPRCGKRTLKKMSGNQYVSRNGVHIRQDTYICSNCGNIVTKEHDDSDHGSGMSALMWGMFLGSLFSGRGRGGGYSGGGFTGGGDFGGGSTGGGGSESGW